MFVCLFCFLFCFCFCFFLILEIVNSTSTQYPHCIFFSFSPAVGLETEIHVQAPDADGVMVECNSGGWFPRPQMEWRDSKGATLPHSLKSYSQDEARFFYMKMTLLLTNMSHGSIICCIFNPVTGEEKQTSIILASEYCHLSWLLISKQREKYGGN